MVKERTEDIMERRISNFDRSKRFFPIEEIPGHLPNDDKNYSLSPAARRAMRDGSLDPNQTHFNSSINRKIKMRDTFTKIFPSYPHGEPTTYNDPNKSFTHLTISDFRAKMKERNGSTTNSGPIVASKETFIDKVCNLLKSTNDIS